MKTAAIPPLTLADWRGTRDVLHRYTQLVGKVRCTLSPRRKHWWHLALHASASGLTTTPMPAGRRTIELLLDFNRHQLRISTNLAEEFAIPLGGSSIAEFTHRTLEVLDTLDIQPAFQRQPFNVETPAEYDVVAVRRYWEALSRIDAVFKRFSCGLRGETSPVHLFPHHFDLALSWFSGRLVPGIDPTDEESADEQMNFGFVTGDEIIADGYFYVTAYPTPADWVGSPLPDGAHWHTQGWVGAVMMYETLLTTHDPGEHLFAFLQLAQQAGAGLMK